MYEFFKSKHLAVIFVLADIRATLSTVAACLVVSEAIFTMGRKAYVALWLKRSMAWSWRVEAYFHEAFVVKLQLPWWRDLAQR